MNNISIPINATLDISLFKGVVHQGIDSRLEGFTKSKFKWDAGCLVCDFHPDEMSVLLRRLSEIADSAPVSYMEAERLIDDILYVFYEVES